MKHIYQISIVLFLSLTCALSVYADTVDQDWENQIAEKLAADNKDADVLWLGAEGERFLGLYTNQTKRGSQGVAIVLHAMGGHPDWPQVIAPIRTLLPEQGWATLSIQLPVVSPNNPLEDYGKSLQQATKRIQTAIALLRKRKFLNIVIVGHSFGAASALAYLEKEERRKTIAFVAIGLHDYAFVKPSIDILALIEKTKIPVLDIYGGRDFKRVIEQAPDRRLAAKKGGNHHYVQVEIEGADHFFNKMEDVLVKRIRSWLDKVAPGMSIPVK